MTTNKKISTALLIVIVFLGFFFRFYKLGVSPLGLYVDEASLGYNAYSILKTGKDEFGKSFPVMFRSFTTFQSPIYSYLTVPFVYFLGLNTYSVRLPSALFGFLTIPLLYFFVKKVAPNIKNLALISALFLAVSPWHILYSRTAYETNIALFFLLLGTYLFYLSLEKQWIIVGSAISFVISMLSYRAEIFIVPLLIVVLFLSNSKSIFYNFSKFLYPIIFSLTLSFILLLPTIKIANTAGFNARTATLNIFSESLQKPWGYNEKLNSFSKLLNNHQILAGKEFLSLYSSYFSPRYIFFLGDSGPRKPFPDVATFFVWQFPLYLVGIYFLIKDKTLGSFRHLIIGMLLLSPIPASLTRDPYSTIRSLPMVIPLVLIVSLGLVKILDITKPLFNKLKYFFVVLFVIFSTTKLFVSVFYLHDYFRSAYWDYGWKQVIDYIPQLDYRLPILIDSSRSHPYIQFLFFQQYNPVTYQKDNKEVSPSEYYTNMTRNLTKNLGRITVRNFDWKADTEDVEQYIVTDYLAISSEQIKEHNLTLVKEIKFPDESVALKIIKTNPRKK